MSENPYNIPQRLILSFSNAPDPIPAARFGFGFSPERAALGDPGQSVGDLLLIKNNGTTELQISLGSADKCSAESFRKAGGNVGRWLLANPTDTISLAAEDILQLNIPGALPAFLEGLRLGAYKFALYLKPEPRALIHVIVTAQQAKDEIRAIVDEVMIVTEAVLLAREWGHEPANVINPITLAERASALADQLGLKCLVLNDEDLDAIKAGAILAVGRGSKTPPRLIILEYSGTDETSHAKPVVLIGKALTFDSGGYSIKGTDSIQGMKYDKSGGLAVIATLAAAVRLNIKTPVIGIIAAAENMISAEAYRPDDIVTTLSGKTIEIVTTDAEGRLVLADAITYTQKIFQPRVMIDLATLTGGVVTALGRVRAGIMGNHQELIQALIAAGDVTMERLWQLPLDDEYFIQTKGDDADLKNSGGREGHAIMGGIFLKQFVDANIPWAHLDIAGVADLPKDSAYQPKGATGFGVRLLLQYLKSLA